jgi:hypothetical protein
MPPLGLDYEAQTPSHPARPARYTGAEAPTSSAGIRGSLPSIVPPLQ